MKKVILIFSCVLIVVGIGIVSSPHISNQVYVHNFNKSEKEFLKKVSDSKNVVTNTDAKNEKIEGESSDTDINNNLKKVSLKIDRKNKKHRLRNSIKSAAVSDNKKKIYADDVIDINGLYEVMKTRNESYLKNRHYIDYNGLDDDDLDLKKYGIKDGCIGYVDIKSLNIHLPIYLGGNDVNLRRGSAHITGTSYPIGGLGTNSVIVAHREFTWARMFHDLGNINIGDEVIINNFRDSLRYRVISKEFVKFQDARPTLIDPERDLVTLGTCQWNTDNKTYDRYIVICERN